MKLLLIRMLVCCLAVVPSGAAGEEEDPFAEEKPSVEGDQGVHDELKPRIVTDQGKKTLKLLETVKISSVRITADTRYDAYKLIKEELAKHGVTVRLKDYGSSKMTPREELALRNVPIRNFLDYLRAWAWWGWILYPDGSITIFDNQCACSWPKDGLFCHDSQYESGSPEVMDKEEKERAKKSDAEQASSGQPAIRSQSKSEGSDKPQPELEGRSR